MKLRQREGTIAKLKYRRVLLKLSGEVLGNSQSGECIDPAALDFMAKRIECLVKMGVEVGVVLGGGNIFRGLRGESRGVARTTGDNMGMLATIINGLAMQNALEQLGLETRLQSAIEMHQVAEPMIQRKALRHLEKGRVVIFAGGTGNPFFTTDSAAALRASEISAEVLLKATKVDGVYTADPKLDPGAVRYEKVSFGDALQQRLQVMDAAAFALCMDNQIPIIVFDFYDEKALERIVLGENVGTLITGEK